MKSKLMEKIKLALNKIFENHRIVFWYDLKKELRNDYESLSLENVEKVEIHNNQFYVKYLILREKADQKFLLYFYGTRPLDSDNWLMDLELSYGEFRSDQTSIWLGDLGLGFDFSDVVKEHVEFFKNTESRQILKERLSQYESIDDLRLKIISVITNSEPRIDSIIEELLGELSTGGSVKVNRIKECSIDIYLWKILEKSYAYKSADPSIKDFSIELFKSAYQMGIDKRSSLNNDAIVFIKRWKDSRFRGSEFEKLSSDCQSFLDIEHDLQKRSYKDLANIDYFKLIDQKIISDLVNDLAAKLISPQACISFIGIRKSTHWYKELSNIYEAINHAAHLFKLLSEVNISISSLQDGVKKYTDNWYKVDLNYRKFIYFTRESAQSSLLRALTDQVENQYTNNFLVKLNNAWQVHVDNCSDWEASSVQPQNAFYTKTVAPILEKGNKVFVIISDALRFEAGRELLNRIVQEDRYEGEIMPALSMLPSYTQLGMAALLPHKELSLNSDKVDTVFADGKSTAGTINRAKIISEYSKGRGTAIQKDDFMKMNNEQSRDLVRENDIIYIYHDEIDHAGKDEETVFRAVESTFDSLIKLIKKLTGANANRILITADHGFIYQDRQIDESDFLSDSTVNGEVLITDRRFLIGKDLNNSSGNFKFFTANQVGVSGDITIALPKTINRIRKKGSSIRFVHGGASLQEAVVPILDIKKKRESDLENVAVEVIGSTSSIITTGQLAVAFFQTQPVSNKVRPIVIRSGLYCEDKLISDARELVFDLTSNDPREREVRVQFMLTQEANSYNNKEVELKLFEQIKDTNRFDKLHGSVKYTLRRSFTSDFDF